MDEKPKRPPRKKPPAKRPGGRSGSAKQSPATTPAEATTPPSEATASPDDATTPAEATARETTAKETAPSGEAAPPEGTPVAPPSEGETVSSPAEQTLVSPPEDQTAVLPPEQPTTILPPVASAPGYAPLTRTAVVAPPRDGRRMLWIVAAVAAAALVAIVLMWVVFSGGSSGDAFIGTWARTAAVGGGLKVEQEGDSLTVTWYDGQLNAQGPFAASADGDVLTFQVPDTSGSMVDATLTTTADPNALDLSLSGATERVTRVTVLTPAAGGSAPAPAPTSTPSPTASPSPSPSVSGSPSPSPTPSGSPSPSPSTSATNQAVIDGVNAIQNMVLIWAGQHGNVFPPPGDVSATGAVGQGQTWPVNPYTGQPMKSGAEPGDYVYEQLLNGQSYKLMGYLANGLTYTAR